MRMIYLWDMDLKMNIAKNPKLKGYSFCNKNCNSLLKGFTSLSGYQIVDTIFRQSLTEISEQNPLYATTFRYPDFRNIIK